MAGKPLSQGRVVGKPLSQGYFFKMRIADLAASGLILLAKHVMSLVRFAHNWPPAPFLSEA